MILMLHFLIVYYFILFIFIIIFIVLTALDELEHHNPFILENIKSFYKKYKISDGGKANFIYGKCLSRDDAVKLVYKSHKTYYNLIARKCSGELLKEGELKYRLDPLSKCTRN